MLGHGIGLRKKHYAHLLEHGPGGVGFFEIISEDFFADGGRPWAVLEHVRRERPVVMHGVSMGLGDARPIDEVYFAQLRRVIERVDPVWVSDHLCWVSLADGRHSHELWPLRYDDETLERVAAKIDAWQERLGRELVIENITRYLGFVGDIYSEPEFLNALVRRTGCGLLLDVNNVYVSAHNLGFDARAYLGAIDRHAVRQLHLAGHTDCGDFIMDTHVGPVPEPVVALYRTVIDRFGPIPALLEWDTDVPSFEVVAGESARMQTIEATSIAERRHTMEQARYG